jgi:hypothetical protein
MARNRAPQTIAKAPSSAAESSMVSSAPRIEDTHRFSTLAVCHVLLHPIALTTREIALVGPLIRCDDEPNTEATPVTTIAE